MPKNKPKVITNLAFVLFIFFAGCLFFFFFEISSFIKEPFNKAGNEKVFIIESGQSLAAIAKNLENKSIIKNQTYFKLFTRFKRAGKKLQAGEYVLSASKTPEQILDIFLKGKVKLYKITIPEGLNIKEIAFVVEKAGFCDKTKFTELCFDKSLISSLVISSLEIESSSLEGYLFPDTYFFSKDTSCENIISTMVKHFKNTFTFAWKKRAQSLGFYVNDIVILASIIEKETADASERALISSVFHNRLKKNIRLESDPTVIYGIKNFDGNIKKKTS